MNNNSRSKYNHLLDDQAVKRWFDNVARGSQITADVYLRRLGSFCALNSLTPASLASLPVKQIEALLMDYVTDHRDNAGSYLQSTLKAVKSWLLANDVELRQKIKISGIDQTPSLREERVPSKDELKLILRSATKQSRVAVALMAYGGVRPEVLGDYKGQDGLRLGDLVELQIAPSEIKFEKTPTLVLVRQNLSKTRRQYFTFLGDEGCNYIIDYLNERRRQKEILNGNSPLVRPIFLPSQTDSSGKKIPPKRRKEFATEKCVRTSNIGDMVRMAIRRSGLRFRPYNLRCYYATQLMLAETKGCMIRDFRTFLMGHCGDIENRYTTSKHLLPQDLVENMRASYLRAQSFLQTVESEVKEDDMKLMFKQELLLISGFAEEEVAKLDLRTTTNEKLHLMMKQRLLGVMNGNSQQVICLADVQSFVEQGWEYVATLPDDRAVVRIPI